MKQQVLKKAILAIALSALCIGAKAQNTFFFGFAPMGNMYYYTGERVITEREIPYHASEYDTSVYMIPVPNKIVDGFTFSAYIDFNQNNNKDQFSFIDVRLNYLHGKNEHADTLYNYFRNNRHITLSDSTMKYGKDFRQTYVQVNYGYIINRKHRVQFPLYIGMALGYAWTQEFGNFIIGMGLGAKMQVYITDQLSVFAGGHLLGAFGMYDLTTNAYLDFGVSYSVFK